MPSVAVLFARADSIYKTLPECDVWDVERDARKWPGGAPLVAHPPCRAWGSFSHRAKPRPDEKQLALWAVDQVRTYGGVLEHPAFSKLWKEKPLPLPGEIDEFGGWTLPVDQFHWGHKAKKSTWLYIVGVDKVEIPFVRGKAQFVVASSRRPRPPEIPHAEREATPPLFAKWLCDLAVRCRDPVCDLV